MKYRKVYNGENVFEFYEYRIEMLKKSNKELREENEKLKEQLNESVMNQRVKEALKKLNSATNHYKTSKENNAIDFAIKILKGE